MPNSGKQEEEEIELRKEDVTRQCINNLVLSVGQRRPRAKLDPRLRHK